MVAKHAQVAVVVVRVVPVNRIHKKDDGEEVSSGIGDDLLRGRSSIRAPPCPAKAPEVAVPAVLHSVSP